MEGKGWILISDSVEYCPKGRMIKLTDDPVISTQGTKVLVRPSTVRKRAGKEHITGALYKTRKAYILYAKEIKPGEHSLDTWCGKIVLTRLSGAIMEIAVFCAMAATVLNTLAGGNDERVHIQVEKGR